MLLYRYLEGIDEELMSQYMFQKMIAHTWMDKHYYANIKNKEDQIQKRTVYQVWVKLQCLPP